jgi:hypothetical protein
MDERHSARGQHTAYLSQRGEIVFHVFHDVEANDKIETTISKRKGL